MNNSEITLDRLLLDFGKAIRTAQEINDLLAETIIQKNAEIAALHAAKNIEEPQQIKRSP